MTKAIYEAMVCVELTVPGGEESSAITLGRVSAGRVAEAANRELTYALTIRKQREHTWSGARL